MADIFDLQDKINQKIVAALAVQLTGDEQRRRGSGTDNVAAYDAFLKGQDHYFRYTAEDSAGAIRFFKWAVELDPDYGRAYAGLANTFWLASIWGWQDSLGVAWSGALLLGRAYLETAMKTPTSLAHQMAARVNTTLRLHEKAVAEAERAIVLDPNDPGAHLVMGRALIFAGRPQDAVAYIERSMRLFCLGKYKKAVNFLEKSLADNPDLGYAHGVLAPAYAHLGRGQEAHAALDNYYQRVGSIFDLSRVRVKSTWGLRQVMTLFQFSDPQVVDRFAEGLLKAGLSGAPGGYYKILKENRLTGAEIRELVFGKTVDVTSVWGHWERIKRTKDGGSTLLAGLEGRSWIEGDTLCNRWPKRFGGQEMCATVFRNPEGTREGNNEYFQVSDLSVAVFSLEE
jgi:tetratricopeptide (TPR) repeat protein